MQEHEFGDFGEVLQAVAEMLPPRKRMSATTIAVYWAALRDLELDEVRHAISVHVNDPDRGEWCPTPSNIRRILGGTTADAALMAWSKVMRTVKAVGAYATVTFDDPFTHATIADMGGWPAVCHTTDEELPFREREFAAKYRAYRGRGADAISFPAKLVGLIDAHNVPRGHGEGDVVLIGQEERARRVLAAGGARDYLRVTVQRVERAQEPMPKLGLLPARPRGMSDADRAAMSAAEAEIAARQPQEVAA